MAPRSFNSARVKGLKDFTLRAKRKVPLITMGFSLVEQIRAGITVDVRSIFCFSDLGSAVKSQVLSKTLQDSMRYFRALSTVWQSSELMSGEGIHEERRFFRSDEIDKRVSKSAITQTGHRKIEEVKGSGIHRNFLYQVLLRAFAGYVPYHDGSLMLGSFRLGEAAEPVRVLIIRTCGNTCQRAAFVFLGTVGLDA